MKKKIIITGSAGFIGFHTCLEYLNKGFIVLGIDNLNKYYDVRIKLERNKILKAYKNFYFKKIDLANFNTKKNILKKFNPSIVIHLAAQAGVRYSLEAPEEYVKSNIIATFNLLETFKSEKLKHFMVASTSSVYGLNKKFPFKESTNTDTPISIYAATKKSVENLCHAYSYNFKMPITALRFFTVYGPWGRPDMALFKFVKNTINRKPIDVYNFGKMKRDFTYVKDVSRSLFLLFKKPPRKKDNYYRVLNIGNQNIVLLTKFISVIEKVLGLKTKRKYMKMQQGDVKQTLSNTDKLKRLVKFQPKTHIEVGIKNFINWYKEYFKI
jgi:UDP-glucuronate 4-epimerase